MEVTLSFKIVKFILNLLAKPKREAFIRACQNPKDAQQNLKQKIIGSSIHAFPDRPTTYKDYPQGKLLTHEAVAFVETTSGSTGNKKNIPYTKSLLNSFENMFLLWTHDLVFHSNLEFTSGKFFMSVSPKLGETIKDDRQYLSPQLRVLLSPFLASNPNNHQGKDAEDFLEKIARDLLKARDLEIISIWSPTYFLSLMDYIEKNQTKLGLVDLNWNKIWPHLKLISCWTGAQAKRSSDELRKKFPNVLIQGKGLLSTEAPMTIPWHEANGYLPLLNETYFEFIGSDEKIYQLHELKIHESYIVLTSQHNGFLRYNTEDLVKVTGFYHQTPTLEFLGRTGQYSDLAGEKLSEQMLREDFYTAASPFLIVPDTTQALPRYVIYTEGSTTDFEQILMKSYHYKLARDLGQLKISEKIIVNDLRGKYLAFFQEQGMVLGDIKERILLNDSALGQKFMEWMKLKLQSSHPTSDDSKDLSL